MSHRPRDPPLLRLGLGKPVGDAHRPRSSPSTSTRRPASAARPARWPARSGTTSARRDPAGRHVPDAADAPRRVLEPDPLQRARLRRRHRLADAQGPVHALRRAGLPRRLPGAGRDRAVRQRHRRRQPGPVHRLRVLRDGLPVRRAALPRRRPARWPSARSAWTASRSASSRPASRPAPPAACSSGRRTTWLRSRTRRVDQLKANGFAQAALYDPQGVGGTSVVTVLAHGDHPEWYGLPADPHVPLAREVLEEGAAAARRASRSSAPSSARSRTT